MDAIKLLEKDHKAAKKAMEEILKMPAGAQKKSSFAGLKHELEVHDSVEEEVFYPAVQSHPKTAGLGAVDKAAHATVETALGQLSELPTEDPDWNATFSAMQTQLLKHVQDEETNFFVKIRESLTASELDSLGERMQAEKERQLKAA